MELDSETLGYHKKPEMVVLEHGNSKIPYSTSFSLPDKSHPHRDTEPVCAHCYSAALTKARQK